MIHEKLIQEFIKAQTEGWAEEDFPAIEQVLFANKKSILNDLSTAIKQVCCQASIQQAAGVKGPAAGICISFLRTNIMDDIWEYRVDLYDEKFFLDPTECCAVYKMDFVWQYLRKRLGRLAVAAKTGMYAHKVRPVHLKKVKLNMAEEYHIIATTITQVAIGEAIKIPEYDALQKMDNLKITMGEYWGSNILIYEETKT